MFILCLFVHLFAYLYLPVSTKIFQYRIDSISDCVPLHSQVPKAKFVVLYVHCMSVSLSIYLQLLCLYLPVSTKIYTARVYFPIQNRLYLGLCTPPLQDCLPCGLSDLVLLLLPPMADLLYHSNRLLIESGSILLSLHHCVNMVRIFNVYSVPLTL